MRIATWNVERLKHRKFLDKMLRAIKEVNADILVLTETDEGIKPSFPYSFHTLKLSEVPADYSLSAIYKSTGYRVSNFS